MHIKKDIGLIIHGPIYFKHFDCNKSIQTILKKYSSLFNNIILTTWADQKEYLDKDVSN